MPSDWLAGIGTGLSVGAGVALLSTNVGVVIGGAGIALLVYVIKRPGDAETGDPGAGTDSDSADEDIVTDGGAVTRETPETAATEHPTVLDVDVVGDRVLASVERGDVSLVVEAPAGISADELEATLEDVPERIDRTAELFTGGDR